MDLIDLLAILGALAWLPFIIQLIISYLTKVKLSLIVDNIIQVGFTTLGPILNLSIAFLAEKKMALIKKIEVELLHESNEKQTFTWKWFEEILLEMDIPTAGTIPYKKHQNAIAILVNQDSIVEKKIGFQKQDFLDENNKLAQNVLEDLNNFKKTTTDLSIIKSTQSFNKLYDHFKNSFCWKIGKYTVVIKVVLANNKNFEYKLNFSLTNLDIRTLERNLDYCQKSLEKIYNPSFQITEKWEWVNIYQ